MPARHTAPSGADDEVFVRAPGAEQVRQPIYQSGIAQWRRFEPWPGPLKETLGDDIRFA